MSIQPAWSYGGGGSSEVADGSITTAKLADPAGMPTVRRALALNSGTYATVLWGPTTAAAFYRWKQVFHGAPAAAFSVMGRNAASRAVVQGLTNGSLSATLLSGAPHPVFVVPNFFLFDGKPHQYELRFGVNTQEAYRDGVLMGSNTLLFSHSTATNTYIGTTLIGEAPSLIERGSIYDVEFIDPASAANSAFFALDGDFVNTAAGSSVADATPSGFISWPTVLSTGGSERAVLAGGPYLVQMSRGATAQALNGSVSTSYAFTFSSTDVDETGGANSGAGTWTAPAPGVISVMFTTRFPAAVLTEEVGISLRKDGTAFRASTQRAGANQVADCIGATTVQAGDVIDAFIDSIGAGNTTLTATNGALVIQFTPRP